MPAAALHIGARWVLAIVAAALLAACPLAHDDPHPEECLSDKDCFTAEGEFCERQSGTDPPPGVCRTRLDAAPTDRPLWPDIGPDRGGDGGGDGEAGPRDARGDRVGDKGSADDTRTE